MDHMSPRQQQQQQQQRQQQQQQQQSPDTGRGRGGGGEEGRQPFSKRRQRSQSFRRQSAPSLSISRALTRSKTLSRESLPPPFNPERCPLIQSFLIHSERNFLLHGHVQLKTGMQTQDRHLFLFTDLLVVAKAKSANHFKQKARVRACELWMAGCTDEVCEGSTSPERSFVIGWPTCNYAATFSSTEQKEKWLSHLKNVTRTEKEGEEPKTIALRVYGKGINTFALNKTLPVSNWDSTNEVIRLALQQFGIIGNTKDFQLWVASRRDNVPYPLIGHEFPFSIQMNHVRHAAFQRRDASTPPADGKAASQGEPLQVCKQCQFILRPRPTESATASAAVMPQKTLKRRNSLISWAFWRSSAPQLNEPALSVARGCLFGQPLSSVCPEGALPKPLMDMLGFLYSEGTWTEWILRKSARVKAVRELRESLDGGDVELPLAREHVHLIAGVFKDFLCSIPGSLLCCELYQEWLEVLEDEDEEEERVQDVKRMISRLPKENALLLRHLLALMDAIQSNAHENHMTSLNLGVCISASMLWQPEPPSSPEGHGAHKVCRLVTFMIDHCQEILEQDPSSLFGGLPRRCAAAEVETDFWLYPQTDSSYDSLENELDAFTSSPRFGQQQQCQCQARPKPLGGSLDSVLTFSDTDLDTRGVRRRRSRMGEEANQKEEVGEETLDSLSLDDKQRRRRSSEPAPLTGVGHVDRREGKGSRRHLEVTTSSSTPASPELSCTSPDSPEPRRFLARRGRRLPSKAVVKESPPEGVFPRSPPPRDSVSWGGLRGYRSLHPNSWLKKERKLSLTQQDHLGKDASRKSAAVGKVVTIDPSKQPLHLKGSPPSPPLLHSDSSGEAKKVKQRSPSLFYKHGALTLSLFKPSRAEDPPCVAQRGARLYQRRVSEPGHRVVERASAFTRARLPSDPGLKVTQVDSHWSSLAADPAETRFCLSPCATNTVRDYFCAHPHSNPHSGQQVALALVEGRREWLKRCSGLDGKPDLDHLLFSEESFV